MHHDSGFPPVLPLSDVVVEFVDEAGLVASSRALLLLLLLAGGEVTIIVIAAAVGGSSESCFRGRARARNAVAVGTRSSSSSSGASGAVHVAVVLGRAPLQLLDLGPDLLAARGVLERQRDVGAQGGVGPRDDGAVALSRVGRGRGGRRAVAAAAVAAAAAAPFSSSCSARGAEPVDQERPRVFL